MTTKHTLRTALLQMAIIPAVGAMLMFIGVILLGGWLLQNDVLVYQKLSINTLAQQSELYLDSTSQLMTMINGVLVNSSPAEQNKLLEQTLKNYPRFTALYLLDQDGKVVLEQTYQGRSLLNLDLSGEKYFRQVQNTEKIFYSDPFISLTTNQIAVTCAVPIIYNNEFTGALVGELNLNQLQIFIEKSTISEESRSFIVDRQGRLLAHPENQWVQEQRNMGYLALVQDGLAGINNFRFFFDEMQATWLVGSVVVIPSGWLVVTTQPAIVAGRPLIILIIFSGVAFIVSVGLFLFVQGRRLGQITRPISALVDKANLLAQGKYSEVTLEQLSEFAEIISLEQSFAHMVEAVQERDRFLEQRVAERTEQLEHQARTMEMQAAELEEKTMELESQAVKLKETTEIAERAKEKADQANQAKSDFLSRMSHELRTPLNGILGYAQILKNDADVTRKQADGLDVIQQSGEHLLTLITDILDLAKIEAGRFELMPTPVKLENFMQNTISIIQMRTDKKRLEVGYQPQSVLPEAVLVDEKRLRQILLNLLNNAVKFTEAGHVILQLTVVSIPDPKQATLRFAVVDTGTGMTPAQIQLIFKPFEQVGDIKKRAEGTGLGLAISKQLVEAMGGQLQVESEPDKGSTFWFELTLPLANVSLTQTAIKHERIIGYEGEPRKILVVDDKLHNRMVFLNILQPLGFEIAMAEDGQEAIEKAKSWMPNLILMDMIMPIKTGFEATQTIRKIAALKPTIIIGTSASSFEKDGEEVKLAGCDAFMSKPVHVENMLSLIGELLHLQWIYQQPTADSSIANNEASTQLVCPAIEILNHWHTLAMEGDLLTIEDEANGLLQKDPQYAPFVEEIQKYTSAMDIEETIRFLEGFLTEK